MAVPTAITDLSTTIGSNSPSGAESASTTDDYLRALSAFIAQLYAGTTSGQIVFPATQNPSSNANTLDDYEEGTFTPTDASGAGLTLTTPTGRYIKVGKVVHFTAAVTYPATADASAAKLGGLPFTAAAANFPVALTSVTTNAAQATVAASTLTVLILTSAGGGTTNAQLSATSLTVSGWYEATA